MALNSTSASQNCSAKCPLDGAEAPREPQRGKLSRLLDRLLVQGVLLVVTGAAMLDLYGWRYGSLKIFEPEWKQEKPAPLVMEGGDPYIRALMRTISASESNVPKPYSVIYGGDHFRDWTQHPDRCVTIPVGPNTGNCSTAAGRYQFITTTWEDQASKYHPEQPHILFWRPYRFDPDSQDRVVHDWLSDSREWGTDLSGLLRKGDIYTVLEILSPTWTSLGYGIETNSMSAYLPEIYYEMLDEELTAVNPVPNGGVPSLPATTIESGVPSSGAPLVTQADGTDADRAGESITPLDEQERRAANGEEDAPFLMPPGEVLRRLGRELGDLL